MDERRSERQLPVRTLHEFLLELDREWNSFRTGSLISMLTLIALFFLFIPRYFTLTLKQPGSLDTLIAIGIISALVYSIYLQYRQHTFYSKWERRIGVLLQMEHELLGDKAP